MSGMQCWAFSPSGMRCEVPVAEHQMDDETGEWIHSVSMTWSDSECIDPSTSVIRQVGQTRTERPVPIFEIIDDTPDLDDAVPGTCFICQCPVAAHGTEGCEAHSCKTPLE